MSANAKPLVPDWLDPSNSLLDKPPRFPDPQSIPTNRELREQRFEIAFDRLLDSIAEGCTLEGAISKYPEPMEIGALNAWIQSDRARRKRYEDAKEYRSEVWAGRAMRIAEGTNDDPNALPEDVARSRLRVDTIMKLIGADNRRVYAPTQQVDIGSNTISILGALAAARSRADSAIALRTTPELGVTIDQPTDDQT